MRSRLTLPLWARGGPLWPSALLGVNEALVANRRLTLLPRPRQVPLSAIALEAAPEPAAGQAP